MFDIGQYFPPPAHVKRIQRYKENRKLFRGEHYDVFERVRNKLSHTQGEYLYISLNMAGLVSKKSADFLFGETPFYSAGNADDSPEQKAIERMAAENDLGIVNYESALGNSYRGDSFYKIRWGQQYGGELDKSLDPFRVFIESQIAEYVFPEADPFNANNIKAYHIALPTLMEDGQRLSEFDLERLNGLRTTRSRTVRGDQWFIDVESHYPGKIVTRKLRALATNSNMDNEVIEWRILEEISRSEEETGVPFPLVVHVPNYATGDGWEGLDDLSELKPLLDELNNRISLIASILDKHSDPAMVVPTGSLEETEDGETIFRAGRNKVFEAADKNEVVPQYITWDGQLQAAFEEIKLLIDQILTVAEIPAVALGKDNSGTSGSSGLAIKFRMNSLLAKINRKRQYYDRGLRKVFLIAQLLEDSKVDIDYAVTVPKIKFKDGLPDDELEQAQIYSMRLGGKPTISQKTALMQIDDLTEQQAQAEIDRMRDEEEAVAKVPSSVFNEPDAEPEETEPDEEDSDEKEKSED
ncbi:phage portal protein [Paenibacillus sp. 1P03SA]|uniref:phage portal protein n=1 Tax=Paenibacillus sp. 1P03SA TaxID=3132294 RepID=UPI0039A3C6CC